MLAVTPHFGKALSSMLKWNLYRHLVHFAHPFCLIKADKRLYISRCRMSKFRRTESLSRLVEKTNFFADFQQLIPCRQSLLLNLLVDVCGVPNVMAEYPGDVIDQSPLSQRRTIYFHRGSHCLSTKDCYSLMVLFKKIKRSVKDKIFQIYFQLI